MSHVVVLTAAPCIGLPESKLAEVRAMLTDAGAPRRLSPSAAEIPVDGPQAPAVTGLDVNCVALEGRRKRLLIADMDSTIIPVECIDEMADFAGVREQVIAITEPAMRGEISFEEALRARVSLMAGFPEARLAEVFEDRVRLNPGARTLVRTMQANGAHCALVSGGFTYFTERVARLAGFDEHRANKLQFEDGLMMGVVEEPILGREAKLASLGEIAARLDVSPDSVLAVGDGANDLAMIGAAGLGVAFRAKPVVAAQADASIRCGDLTALLYLQGFGQEEFVTDS